MGYLNKIGNVLGDVASFAVPAGLSGGLTLLSGGTLNPATQGGLMALLGTVGAGAKGLQGNEQQERLRKMQLAQQKANEGAQAQTETSMGRANLINALKPGAGARGSITQAQQVATPKAGLMENIAGGIGTGATMASQVMQAQQALKDAAARRALVEAQTGALNARAGALGNMGTMTRGSQLAGQPPDPGSDQSKSFLSSIAKIAGQGGTSEEIGGRLGNVSVPMRGEANRGGGFFEAIPAASERLGGVLPAVGGIDNAPEVQAAIAEGLQTGAAARRAIEESRLDVEKKRLELEALRGAPARAMSQEETAVSNRLLAAQPSLKTADQVAASYAKVKALAQDLLSEDSQTKGAGIVTLVNVFNRGFVDEGAAVRAEDIENLRLAQSGWDRIMSQVQALKTGEAFSDELVANIESAADQLYAAYLQGMEGSINMRLENVGGLDDAARGRVRGFLMAPLTGMPVRAAAPRVNTADIRTELSDIEAELARLRGEESPSMFGGLGSLGLGLGRTR